jgi:hypothetical protein
VNSHVAWWLRPKSTDPSASVKSRLGRRGSPAKLVRGLYGEDMLFQSPPPWVRGRILAALLLRAREPIRRSVEVGRRG